MPLSEIKGEDIAEVWDYRKSTATPQINRMGNTWVVQVFCKKGGGIKESIDTRIPVTPGDAHDKKKLIECFEAIDKLRLKYEVQ